ncbi:nucleoside-triphosphatase [Nonomuraea sp. 3N208]|uniref:nucleoside-triphosphatase n=1 Tax=Nonomuraea sp. 3N208 TaxID=3457421 RepID=UPI003FCD36F6
MAHPHIMLTAPPRTGKTTVIRRLAELLREAGVPVRGFVSDEVREHGHRVGFTIEELGGEKAVMAHVSWVSGPRIGQYGVNVPEFERIALPAIEHALTTKGAVALIDEIGPMELLSPAFLPRCVALFAADIPVVATIHQRSRPALKSRFEAELITVTPQNRDELPRTLSRLLSA